jgi:Mg2+ and Co2+ transporter CorA
MESRPGGTSRQHRYFKEEHMPLAIAGTGYGIIGILVIILLVVLIVYFARRA